MTLSIETRREVQFKLDQWAKESAMHFCAQARNASVKFTNITYPTGLKMIMAEAGGYKAEVPLRTAKMLRANGYKVVS